MVTSQAHRVSLTHPGLLSRTPYAASPRPLRGWALGSSALQTDPLTEPVTHHGTTGFRP